MEGLPVHDGFAAHFKIRKPILRAQRKRTDGARVFSDVLAHFAVAPRDRLSEVTMAIMSRHGESIHLQLSHIAVAVASQQFAHAPVEIAQLRAPVNVAKKQVEDLVQREPDRVAMQVRAWMAED